MSTERKTVFVNPVYFRALLVFSLFALVAFIWIRSIPKVETYEQKREIFRLKTLQTLKSEDEKKLNHYAWVDEKKGITQIPIDRAEEIVMAELKTKTAQPTTVTVESPYPAGLQQAPVANPQEVKT